MKQIRENACVYMHRKEIGKFRDVWLKPYIPFFTSCFRVEIRVEYFPVDLLGVEIKKRKARYLLAFRIIGVT